MHTPRSILLALSTTVILATLFAWAVFAIADYDSTLDSSLRENAIIADLLQEHAHRTIEASDLVLQQLEAAVEGGGGLALGASPEVVHERLVAMADLLPQVGSLWIIGPDGAVINSSVAPRPMGGRYDDRRYFQAQREAPGAGTFIGELLEGRQTGLDFFAISRRIDGPGGDFGGIVVAAIHTSYFQQFYAGVAMPSDSTLAILREDGALLVREPLAAGSYGARFPDVMRGLTPQTPRVASRIASPVDGSDRLVARRLVKDYPLVALASRKVEAVLAPFWQRQLRTGAVVVVLILTVVALTMLGLRALQGERRLKEALAAANVSLEDRVRQRTAELEQALADKNLLLSEVYHRVKNNLQMIESLLSLQSRTLTDDGARNAFRTARRRINALGLVHQQLLGAGDLATVRLDAFLGELCANLAEGAGAERRGLKVTVDVAPLPANLDRAIPLGLLVNELLSNALLHGYRNGSSGTITVRSDYLKDSGALRLLVRDDGCGIPSDAEAAGKDDVPRSGMRIVRALAAQLGGELTVRREPQGTEVTVTIPWPEAEHG
ncbi:sensor histidine kinase [Caenispirillum salinarum]|uniref:sensor histidine kinase n=1 Tax=Caenispirillum salinarum TaxID=859058 RepID=UPI0038507C88